VAEAVALVLLIAFAGGVVALGAVLDGARSGTPASIAVLAPLAEAARHVRGRVPGTATPGRVAGAGLLVASVVRLLALPLDGSPLLGAPLGTGWVLVADAVWWCAAALLVEPGARRRLAVCALALEAPLVVALATRLLAVGAGVPVGVEAPVALLLVVVVGGALLPWAVRGRAGARPLLVRVGLAAQPVSAAAVAAALLLGGTGGVLVLETAVMTALVVVVSRRFPVLSRPRLARLGSTVLLPLALLQLGAVAVLARLA
jgi:hypothetical protein